MDKVRLLIINSVIFFVNNIIKFLLGTISATFIGIICDIITIRLLRLYTLPEGAVVTPGFTLGMLLGGISGVLSTININEIRFYSLILFRGFLIGLISSSFIPIRNLINTFIM